MLPNTLLIAVPLILMAAVSGLQASGDPVRGQELAQICTDCHRDDYLGDEDTPAIGGMNEAAIFKELMAFKSGARVDEYEDMVEIVEEFDKQDLADLAAYVTTLPGPEDQ